MLGSLTRLPVASQQSLQYFMGDGTRCASRAPDTLVSTSRLKEVLQPNGDLTDTWSGPSTPKLMAPFPATATGHPRIHATIQQDGNKLHYQTQFRAGAYAVTTAFAALQARGSVRERIPTEQQCSIERCTNQCRHMVQPQASSATLPFPQPEMHGIVRLGSRPVNGFHRPWRWGPTTTAMEQNP